MEKVINNETYGSDFELFLFDTSANEVVNAKPYVKGSKRKPFNFDKSNPFWCTSLDNISFEGNIAPCTTADEFDKNIDKVISYLKSTLPEGIVPIHECAVRVNPDYLKNKEARTLGCEPTYNAYTLNMNMPPSGESTNLRTCCTHIHMKYENMTFELSAEWVKAMDLFLGMPSLVIEPKNERRELYGKLGEMRFSEKTTTEYRVLSSFFSATESLRKWVFNNTLLATNWINAGNRVSDDMASNFKEAMQNNDDFYVKHLIETFNIPMPQ